MLRKNNLQRLYQRNKMSAQEIATLFKCSQTKINYWLKKFDITKRTISEAVYIKNNVDGDPFTDIIKTSAEDYFLQGLGLGIYWGEGTKANKNSVRVGNTDPDLLLYFIKFLTKNYNIKTSKLRFGLQIFSDISEMECLYFWCKKLCISRDQFYKVVITKSFKKGTYSRKVKYGVLTIYFNNTKLRNILNDELEKLRKMI